MINNIADQLIRDEGKRLKVYKDTKGILTIGVGRNLEDKGISDAESENMLWNDLKDVALGIVAALPWSQKLDPVRFGVLKNMAFNMGVHGLLEFRQTLVKMQAGDWDGAATEMLNSLWAEQVGARAQRLALQLRTGEWQ